MPSDPVYVSNYHCLGQIGIEEAEREVGRNRWSRKETPSPGDIGLNANVSDKTVGVAPCNRNIFLRSE